MRPKAQGLLVEDIIVMLPQLLHHLVVGMAVPLQDLVEGMVVTLPNRPRPRVEGTIVEETQQQLLLLLLLLLLLQKVKEHKKYLSCFSCLILREPHNLGTRHCNELPNKEG